MRRQPEIKEIRSPLSEQILDFEPVFAVVAVARILIGVLGVGSRAFA
jgi:hypothetical protein